MLHLFVLRSIVVASMSLVNGVSMYDIATTDSFLRIVNLSSFAIQVITIIIFMKLIPVKTVLKIMDDKSFYKSLFQLTLVLNVFIIFNSYMFYVDHFSVNLAIQEIIISVFVLVFFYIMLLLLIKIFSLDIYKQKTKELEVQIDKDKALTSAVFNFAEIIIEINCTEDKLTRVFIDAVERDTNKLPKPNEFIKMQSSMYTHPDDMDKIGIISSDYLIESYNKGKTEFNIEYRAKRIEAKEKDDRVSNVGNDYLWYRIRINISRDEETKEIVALLTVDDINEEIELRQLAETDPLTGAFNKATFATKVDEYISTGKEGVLFMFDLDNFKGINDNMGHSSGDMVLCEVYNKVSALFREKDIVGRVGGDEFVVFMTGGVNKQTIERKAKEICLGVSKTYHAENGIDIEITGSVGIAIAKKDGTDFETLFDASDMAMYRSKNAGKNTYTIFDSGIPEGFEPREKEEYIRRHNERISNEREE